VVPKTALALLARAGGDPAAAIATLCLEATVLNIRGHLRLRDEAVEAASVLAEGVGKHGASEIRVQPRLLSRMTRNPDLA